MTSGPRFKLVGARPAKQISRTYEVVWWVFYALFGSWTQAVQYFAFEMAMKIRKGTSVWDFIVGILTIIVHVIRAPHGGDRHERFWFGIRSRVISPAGAVYWWRGQGAEKTPYPAYEIRERVRQRDGYTCRVCGSGRDQGADLHVDHVIPRKWGGSNELSNLRTLCRRCHGLRHLRAFRD